jgi:hypothetical protein
VYGSISKFHRCVELFQPLPALVHARVVRRKSSASGDSLGFPIGTTQVEVLKGGICSA